MRVLFRLFSVLFLAAFFDVSSAAESQTISNWPSVVTTQIIHADGSASYLCNSTNGALCNFVIIDENCTIDAKSSAKRPNNCKVDKLHKFQLGLGKVKTVEAKNNSLHYCASSIQAIVVPACLKNVVNMAVPYSEGIKVTSHISISRS